MGCMAACGYGFLNGCVVVLVPMLERIRLKHAVLDKSVTAAHLRSFSFGCLFALLRMMCAMLICVYVYVLLIVYVRYALLRRCILAYRHHAQEVNAFPISQHSETIEALEHG